MRFFSKLLRLPILPKLLTSSKRHTAFTLAEVLITLGIIGVIAAIVIPILINNANQQAYNTGAKDAYSLLSQLILKLQADNIRLEDYLDFDPDISSAPTDVLITKIYCKYMKCVKIGTESEIFGANNNKYKYYGGGYKADWPVPTNIEVDSAQLNNGYLIDYYWGDDSCSMYGVNACVMSQIDINGNKGPNTFGEDIYRFYISSVGDGSYTVIPMGANNDTYSPLPGGCTYGSTGMKTCSGCTAQRLYNPASMK